MVRKGSAWLGVVLVAAGLAGCVGDDLPEADVGADGPTPGDGSDDAIDANATVFAFPGGAEPYNLTLNASGTLPASTAVTTGEPDMHPIPGVPERVLTWLRAEATAETDAVFGSTLRLSVALDDGTVHSTSTSWSDGEATLEAMFEIQSGGARLEVTTQGFHESDVDYELVAEAWADPTVVHPRSPVALALAPGMNVTAERATTPTAEPGGEPPAIRFLLFDATDAFIMPVESSGDQVTFTVPEEAAVGSFVLVPSSAAAPLRLQVDQSGHDGTLTRLAYTVEYGPAHPAAGPAPVMWTYDVVGRPVSVGIYADLGPAATVQSQVGGTARVESPAGVLYDGPWGCGMFSYCLSMGDGRAVVVLADRMSPELVAGEYAFEADAGASNYEGVGTALVWYAR